MSQTWLPGDTRQRIQDLIKDSNSTQADLAAVIGLSESALSRYLKGQTEMLGDGYIIRIAKHFNVSTDFLLGETDIPKRSCQAPRWEPPGKLHKDKKKTVQPSAITHFYKLAQSYPNRPLFCFSFAGAFLHRESGISDTGSE